MTATSPDPGTDTNSKDKSRAGRAKNQLRGSLPGFTVMIASDIAVNLLSGPIGYRGLTGIVAFAGIIAGINWLRDKNGGAALRPNVLRLFLIPASALVILAEFSSKTCATNSIGAAVILTSGAVACKDGLMPIMILLLKIAAVGGGLAVICWDLKHMLGGFAIIFVVASIFGVGGIAVGIALTNDSAKARGLASICGGVTIACGGLIGLPPSIMSKTAVIGFVIASALLSVKSLTKCNILLDLTLLVSGASVVIYGFAAIDDSKSFTSAAFICLGIAAIWAGCAFIDGRSAPIGAALIVIGIATIATGSKVVIGWNKAGGVAVIVGGIACAGIGVAFIGPAVLRNHFGQMVEFITGVPVSTQNETSAPHVS